ncbi:MAG: hypothetical protein J6X49_00435 [Victivallales bacterium]|nr:hypothetical protein [Victivallales bacterium]
MDFQDIDQRQAVTVRIVPMSAVMMTDTMQTSGADPMNGVLSVASVLDIWRLFTVGLDDGHHEGRQTAHRWRSGGHRGRP